MGSEMLANNPFDSVSLDSVPHFARCGDADSSAYTWSKDTGEIPVVDPPADLGQLQERRAFAQAAFFWKSVHATCRLPMSGRWSFHGRWRQSGEPEPSPSQAASRFRPRARLRLMILRPCLVDILFKKPWVLDRLRRLG
jgi:hypothetical protein